MATVRDFREDIISEDVFEGIRAAADGVMSLPAELRPAAYASSIEGKDPTYITAMQIALFWRTPEAEGGMGRSQALWDADTVGIQHFARFQHSDAFKAITGVDQPTVSNVGDVVTINHNGKMIQMDWSFRGALGRDNEYGFNLWVDGDNITSENFAEHGDVIAAFAANRDAIIESMVPVIQARLAATDNDVDTLNRSDIDNVLKSVKATIIEADGTDFDGRIGEVVDAMTVAAFQRAIETMSVEGPNALPATVRNAFLNDDGFKAALASAEEVLDTAKVTTTTTTEEVVVAADDTPVLANALLDAAVQTPQEAADGVENDAMKWDQFLAAFTKYDTDAAQFTGPVTEDEAKAVAMYYALWDVKDGRWAPAENQATMTAEEMLAHPDYQAVMTAYAALDNRPQLTVSAGTDNNALTITASNLDSAEAIAAFLAVEENATSIRAQIEDVLNGDDTEITADEATAALAKINAQLEGKAEGSLDHAVLSIAKARAEEVITSATATAATAVDADADADVAVDATATVVTDPQIVTKDGGRDVIREIQLYAAMAKAGGLASLADQNLSSIDGRAGRLTGNSMVKMMDLTVAELNALGSPEKAAERLDQMMTNDEAFRTAVFSGLKSRISSDPEDVREFLKHQGVDIGDGVVGADLLAKVNEYEALYTGTAAEAEVDTTTTVDASLSITIPDNPTNAFGITIAGISTPEELTAYLAEHGERVDTEIRAALYGDITAVDARDGLSAEELDTLNGWIDAQMEGASDVEKALLERAKGLVEADTTPEIVVSRNNALLDNDRVLDGNILTKAQEAFDRTIPRGEVIPDEGVLTKIEGKAMLVRQIEGELVVTQLHAGNVAAELKPGYLTDPEAGSIEFDAARADGLRTVHIAEDEKSTVIESEELADAIDKFDGRAGDERLVTNFDLPGTFDSATVARGLEALERALERNGAGSLSVTFIEGANGTTAEINYGDGQKLEIPKGLYDAIMEEAGVQANRDNSLVVEVSAPAVGGS